MSDQQDASADNGDDVIDDKYFPTSYYFPDTRIRTGTANPKGSTSSRFYSHVGKEINILEATAMDEEDIKSNFNEAINSINDDPASETNSQLSTCLFASFGKKTRGYPSRNEKETTFLSSVYDFFIKPCEDILTFILAEDFQKKLRSLGSSVSRKSASLPKKALLKCRLKNLLKVKLFNCFPSKINSNENDAARKIQTGFAKNSQVLKLSAQEIREAGIQVPNDPEKVYVIKVFDPNMVSINLNMYMPYKEVKKKMTTHFNNELLSYSAIQIQNKHHKPDEQINKPDIYQFGFFKICLKGNDLLKDAESEDLYVASGPGFIMEELSLKPDMEDDFIDESDRASE
ncbi:hypothetical protein DASC09_009050 [Saccharomycopsis crataegensis]|uniref:Uncharacterized protein n=1 Tax=Saccharomycopsis crataegensis TaxID=43959 RepID=A0AAV5QF55_9ASCO|nr:hypothetical protein DASC09_009050 [Saccharomycopsis crataegensis]